MQYICKIFADHSTVYESFQDEANQDIIQEDLFEICAWVIYGCCVCKAIQYGYVKDQDNVVFDVHLSEGENDLGVVF